MIGAPLPRFGSEQLRGHGIPEAIEAIILKKSAMSPKVGVLKPLASAIAIGSDWHTGPGHRGICDSTARGLGNCSA